MKRALFAKILLLMLIVPVFAYSVEKIYFGDVGHDKIRRCNLNGSSIEELVTTGLEAVGGIAIDRTGGKMYWADWPAATSCIQRANLDGSNVEDVHTGLGGPSGVALDVANGKLYWTEFSSQMIRRSNLDGSNIEDLITTGLVHPNYIALDVDGGKMYWTEGATIYSAKVRRADLDGSNIELLVSAPLVAPMGIALDVGAGKMYWADLGSDSLYRANLDGSNLEAIIWAQLGTPVGVDLDLSAGKIYFSDSGAAGAKIQRANLDGSLVQDIISSGIGACYGLALGPDTAEALCTDASLEGPWLVIITGIEPYDYANYLIFDGQGTIDELGSFNVPDSAGSYSVEADCDMTGYLWSDGYTPFTGHLDSDTTGWVDIGGGPMSLIKVRDAGALEGCWYGWFVQGEATYEVVIYLDEFGAVEGSSGFPNPVTGYFFHESGYVAGHIITGDAGIWQEINLRDASVVGDTVMTGTFHLDCGECDEGTFNLTRCSGSPVQDTPGMQPPVLYQNFPNPFNPATAIVFRLHEPGHVSLCIYDAAGRLVHELVNEHRPVGVYKEFWSGINGEGQHVASGVYFYRLNTGAFDQTRRMVLIR